jgi:RES domain
VTLFRCFAWRADAKPDAPDGALWCPRPFQGDGRHDNPEAYGCLYLSDRPLSCIVEQFAAFRGQRLIASMLRRRGLPLALARLELDARAELIDLDDPAVLKRERLRPSRVATRERSITQAYALELFQHDPLPAGLRWWSTWEAQWVNVTLFERGARRLRLIHVAELTLDHADVREAAEWFGLRLV